MSSLEPQIRYWRSFADLEDSPEFLATLADEFPEHADQLADPLSRRRFFQLMGASLALAGISGCTRWEEDHVVPLSRRPDNYVPGIPVHFATSMEVAGVASGLLAKSFDGRPIKVEGNPDHPMTGAHSTAMQQASLLHLYDPDRSTAPVRREGGKEVAATWDDLDNALAALASAPGKLFVLSEATFSPTVMRMRALLGKRVEWYEWEPVSFDNELNGLALAYKGRYRTQYRFDQAKTIISLDCDFLGEHPAQLRYAADWSAARDPESGLMNRLYAVESHFSATGAAADHRLPLRSDLIRPFLEALEAKLNSNARTPDAAFLKDPKVARFLDAIAREFAATSRRRTLICVGPRQPAVVHAIAARINEASGATGMCLEYRAVPGTSEMYRNQIVQLDQKIKTGAVDRLLILGGNPVYDAPADLEFGKTLKRVKQSVHLSLYDNETSAASGWHIPRTHYLEEWGDGCSWDGTYTLRQPLIRPLFGSRSVVDVLKVLAGMATKDSREIVRETFIERTGKASAKLWREAVQLGFVKGTSWPTKPEDVGVRGITSGRLTPTQLGPLVQPTQVELTFTSSTSTFDGRFANNAWLQETPDFLTKLTWDNAALIAPKTAADLGIAHGDVISLSVEGASIEVPAYVMPGQAPSTISLELGYGRQRAGVVAGYQGKVDSVGVNAYPLRRSNGMDTVVGVKVSNTGKKWVLASTQDHFQIDTLGREETAKRIPGLVRTTTMENYARDPGFVTEDAHTEAWGKLRQPSTVSEASWEQNLFKTRHEYDGNKWGMTIDLTKCIGCNSCMLACQAENNVPVVGKTQVVKNREMHWIRIDRYFAGDPDDPQVAYQPVHCQQCENAPCEQVCPVGATLHSHDGLNDQAYNRCVGTRYCANNCPYKVRRFNFHYWHQEYDKARSKVRHLIFNPEVTVRSRGVMEKCTWCVQRIRAAGIKSRIERRELVDGDIKTACQQACPTDAIVFGDLNDPSSQVTKLQNVNRAYYLMPSLNNRPRNAFLARIRNPNPALEKAAAPEAEKASH